MRWTKLLAVVAVLASVPLFFTYQIKHVLFPRGYLFVFMYSAGLLSVLVVPVLLIVETAVAVVVTRRGMRDLQWWHITAAVISGLTECTFLIARNF